MPRSARKVSSTGIYHVMIRGINKEEIFYDEIDKDKFIEIMYKTKEKTGYELYAYCLMSNHAHFLIKENKESIGQVMKKICGEYGGWFNYRHQRIGHLFQDRFKSECVETDSYFTVVLKYILNNSVKAGIVREMGEYKWDSYNEYIKKKQITDTELALSMLSESHNKAKKIFEEEMKKKEEEIVKLTVDKIRRSDKEAEEIIKIELVKLGTKEVGELTGGSREQFIKKLKSKGLCSRQIMGLTGLTRRMVDGV